MRNVFMTALLTAMIALCWCGTAQAQDPVKVYILAGQSNMEGKGTIEGATTMGTLRYNVINDAANFGHLVDGSNNWITRTDTHIYSTTDGGESGGLSVGYGSNYLIGPELGFGVEMGNLYGEDVLLIKTAWGGKSLIADFRPPSAVLKRGGEVGFYYNQMLTEVNNVLSNIGTYVPGYAGQGYDIQGFGWHQGFNDRINSAAVAEYEENLVDFINDVRFDLGASNLPFVLATTSMDDSINTQAQNLIDAQLAVGNPVQYPEFDGNVISIDARPFWFPTAQSPADEGYHWNRNARTYYLMGEAMGQAMATMSSYQQYEASYLSVDLQSGEIRIVNPSTNLADMDLEAYTITSASGALNPASWDAIAGNYDGNGDASVDSGNWTIGTSTTGELTESADVGGSDGLITIGSEVSLGIGAWQGALVKDLAANYTDTNGNVINLNVRYTGADNILADLNTDGTIDIADWAIFVTGIQMDMSSLSPAQAYLLGDLDGDFDNDIDDFDTFRRAFELLNPEESAFEDMLAEYSVPEPSSALLLSAMALGMFRPRRGADCRGRNDR